MKDLKASLIVSTYNRPEALNLVLQSIARQTVLPAEVVIGDDGSTRETADLIDSFRKDFPVPIKHIWQEDDGFRLAMSRNKAIAATEYEYIIQVDGDLTLHPMFVADHLHFAREGYFLKGGRSNLDRKATEKMCRSGKLPELGFFSEGLMRRINAVHSMPLATYLAPRYKKNRMLGLGTNMSFWKKDCVHINGYDEFFEGWGGEDYDFASRMLNSGIRRLYLKFAGIGFHLWHRDLYMHNDAKNDRYFNMQMDKGSAWAADGMDKYL